MLSLGGSETVKFVASCMMPDSCTWRLQNYRVISNDHGRDRYELYPLHEFYPQGIKASCVYSQNKSDKEKTRIQVPYSQNAKSVPVLPSVSCPVR